MDTIFMNSGNSKTSKPHVLILKLTDLEITEVVLVHCNFVNNDYQQDSRVLYTFFPNKPFGQLLDISPTNFIFLKTLTSEFQAIEVWFIDQNSQPIETEDRINLTLVIK